MKKHQPVHSWLSLGLNASLLATIGGCAPSLQSSNGAQAPPAGASSITISLGNLNTTSDPALAMQNHVTTYPSPWPQLQQLDSGLENLRKLSGTLARIQFIAARKDSARSMLPTVLINGQNDCIKTLSIGLYKPDCQTIKVDYTDGQIYYEHPVEIEAALAHEWGHHIAFLSNLNVSQTEQEILADCFAGVVFGYYLNNKLITSDEAQEAFQMMAQISNNSGSDIHPNQQNRTSAFLGGMSQIADPQGQYAPLYANTCGSLEQILDTAKVRSMGLGRP
jgi:hypothetical protein